MNFIKTCISRPVLVAMIMTTLAGLGVFCWTQLSQELFPDVEFPVVTVVTRYEGSGPEEIEQLISKKLEDEISTVEGIKYLNSISQQGMSLVIAEFYLGTDVDVAAADVRAKVDVVRNDLPEEADDPIVEKFDFNAQPIMTLAISAPRSLREVFQMADERVKDRISTVPDVASVEITGGEEREIHILANQQRLRAYGLSIVDLLGAVSAANLESPGGYIRQNSREFNIRLRGKFKNLDEIRNMRVMLPTGGSVYLRELAEVKDTYKDIREKARTDGKVCVGMTIQKRAGGNAVAVDAGVREQIEKLKKILPDDYEILVIDESATWITSSVANVRDNMISGIILTAITLLIFLHSFRSVIIISLTMPVSVLATFIIMYLAGFTLNMMSLMGLAMTVGVLVNNAILVLENIYRYLQLGHDPIRAANEGTSEIAVAVASTTLTNVVVFVPIAFMGGIVGQFFKDFGLTATFATIVSLFVSFTLAPMMAAKLLSQNAIAINKQNFMGRFGRWFEKHLDNLKDSYAGGLHWCLRHRWLLIIVVFFMLIGSFMLAGQIGSEFITNMDQGKFTVMLEMPVGTRLEETDAAMAGIEEVLADKKVLPELITMFSLIGTTMGGDVGGASQAVNIGQMIVQILPKDERDLSTTEVMDRLRPSLAAANIPGANIKILEISGGGGGEAPIQMEIIGDDISRLYEFSVQAMKIMNNPERVPGAVDIDTNYRLGQPELRIIPDREKCLDNGVNSRYLSSVVAATFEGLLAGEYREGAFDYDIRVKADEDSRKVIADISELTIMNAAGRLIPLPQLAEIKQTTGPSQIFRKNRQNMIKVTCDVSGSSPGQVVAAVNRELEPLLREYPEVTVFFGGEVERMQESFARMGVALIMAVCLTYMLLAALLESFTQPLIIMVSLPLSLIGVFAALFLMGGTFSIFSIMSIVMLVGLVINNSIIVIDYINILRKQGKGRTDAIIESGTTRLRPILMANLTTVIALIPLAMGSGWGGEMRAPMAMVQIGGLLAGGWMGLLVVPVIYTISDDFNNWVRRLIFGRG